MEWAVEGTSSKLQSGSNPGISEIYVMLALAARKLP